MAAMRGRAIWVVLLAAASLAACSRRASSLYIEPGRRDPEPGAAQAASAPQAPAATAAGGGPANAVGGNQSGNPQS
jgi:hypothetical protein